jgi:hypothetical protein
MLMTLEVYRFSEKSSSLVELDLFDGDSNFPRSSKVVTNLKSKTTCGRMMEGFSYSLFAKSGGDKAELEKPKTHLNR